MHAWCTPRAPHERKGSWLTQPQGWAWGPRAQDGPATDVAQDRRAPRQTWTLGAGWGF